MSHQTTTHAKSKDGNELIFQQQHSDAPLLPIQGLARLHEFRPDLVDWVQAQTQIEAENRRRENSRTNTFIFVERLLAQLITLLLVVLGIGGGVYAATLGHESLGITIVAVTIGTLAVSLLVNRK